MRTTEQVIALYRQRVAERADAASGMEQIRAIVNGEAQLPHDELSEESKPAVADLISIGGEQMAMRVASVLPDLDIPPLNPASKPGAKRAGEARQAVLGWWEANRIELVNRKRARHLLFDGESPVVIVPDYEARMPKWELRDPIASYPPPVAGLSPIVDDCIFTYLKSMAWLKATYPAEAAQMTRTARTPDATVLLLEYWDDEDCVLCAIGENQDKPYTLYQPPGQSAAYRTPGGLHIASTSWAQDSWTAEAEYVELNRYPHGLGMCPVVYPTRITLDKQMGMFNKLVSLFEMQARLMALSVIGVERGILKETWVENTVQGSPAKIIQKADARSGLVGNITDGKMTQFGPDPGFMTMPMLDRLEYAIRQSGGISPELGGASQANVRTGRRGENILSAAIDFPIQEAQTILGFSMSAEVQVAIAVAKRWWGNREMSYHVNWKGAQGRVTYRPNKTFESDRAIVSFGLAGADASQIMILTGQELGLELISKREARKRDARISDPERMANEVDIEKIDQAIMAGLQQRATQLDQAGMPLEDLIRIRELRNEGKDLAEAYRQAQREAQERQAQEVPQGAPEAQPGIEPPGIGNTQPVEATQGLSSDQANIVSMLRGLRTGQMTSPAERQPSQIGA
jgi:hypothetical protein